MLDKTFLEIKVECLNMIKEKNVDLYELSFELGISLEQFVKNFQSRTKDFSFYLRTYNILLEWEV